MFKTTAYCTEQIKLLKSIKLLKCDWFLWNSVDSGFSVVLFDDKKKMKENTL